MPTYIVLIDLNETGAKNIKQSPDRLEKYKQTTEELGGEFNDFYMTFGAYDFAAIVDLPDDEAAAQLALTYGRGGAGETETIKAFTEDEYREIIDSLPE